MKIERTTSSYNAEIEVERLENPGVEDWELEQQREQFKNLKIYQPESTWADYLEELAQTPENAH